MRKYMTVGVIAILSILLVGCNGAGALSAEGYYEYPDTTGMHAKEMLEACRIPQNLLDVMSEEALAQAIVEFPLLLDVNLSSQYIPDLDFFAKECDAYKELLTRENGKEALYAKAKELEESGDPTTDVDLACILNDLKTLLYFSEEWYEELTSEELKFIEEEYPSVKREAKR